MPEPKLRDEAPPDDAVVVIRGGLHSLDLDRVRATAEDSVVDLGVYCVSVFAADDGDVRALCQRLRRLQSPGVIWVARCGDLRRAGFALLATDEAPHFDIVLPDLTVGTLEALVWCFESRPNTLKEAP